MKKKLLFSCIPLFFCFLLLPTLAEAQESSAKIVPLDANTSIPEGLKWKDGDVVMIKPRFRGKKFRMYALLKGWYKRQDWSMTVKQKKIRLSDKTGRFVIAVPINSPSTRVQLVMVGPRGEIEKYGVEIKFDQYADFRKQLIDSTKIKVNNFNVGLGLSYIKYDDSRISDLKQVALTLKGGYTRRFSSIWDAGMSFYFTALPLSFSGGARIDDGQAGSARFLGVNLRVGYKLNHQPSDWNWYLGAGYYYTALFAQGNLYGFRNMQGPQLFPTVRKQNANGTSVYVYFKYSPVSDGFSFRNFSDYELAMGTGYVLKPNNGKSLGFTLDLAKLKLNLSTASVNTEISSISASLGAAYFF